MSPQPARDDSQADPQKAAIRSAVGSVVDPCGRMNGTGLTFGELGMIDRIVIDTGGKVTVHLLLDDPVCIYLGEIAHDIRQAAQGVDGVTSVELKFRGDELWTQDRMTPEAREKARRWSAARTRSAPLVQLGTREPGRGC